MSTKVPQTENNNNFSVLVQTWRLRSEAGCKRMSGDSPDKVIQLKEMEKSPEKALAVTDAVRTVGALEPLIIKKEEIPTAILPTSEASQGLPKEISDGSSVTGSKEKSASNLKRDDGIYLANSDDIDGPVLTNDTHSMDKDAFTDDEDENEKEECIVTCLYYTSQCCDCSIM